MAKKKPKIKLELTVTVDTNDADYLVKVSQITQDELNKILPLINAIKKFKPYTTKTTGNYKLDWSHTHNYHIGEHVRDDLGEKSVAELYPQFSEAIHELFQEFCPYGENGFHTVESITVSPFIKKTKLL